MPAAESATLGSLGTTRVHRSLEHSRTGSRHGGEFRRAGSCLMSLAPKTPNPGVSRVAAVRWVFLGYRDRPRLRGGDHGLLGKRSSYLGGMYGGAGGGGALTRV